LLDQGVAGFSHNGFSLPVFLTSSKSSCEHFTSAITAAPGCSFSISRQGYHKPIPPDYLSVPAHNSISVGISVVAHA
jgi:hypothetical protein